MRYSRFIEHWGLDRTVTFLNHGSFGACPRPVLERQSELQRELEAQPLLFLGRQIEERMDAARRTLAKFLTCDADGLCLVRNATSGVNTVLRSLRFERGDQILTTNHVYNACKNVLDFTVERWGTEIVVADLPFPIEDAQQLVDPILAAATPRTKLALIDHVTSTTALVLPLEPILDGLAARGIDVLVDGAHAPGMIPLDLQALAARGATYYAGNCHKWLCTPKGAAFLYVREDRQEGFRPLTISHGANAERTDRSRFRLESDWLGTDDPSSWLCIPAALEFLGGLLPGGISELTEHNRSLALEGRKILEDALSLDHPSTPESTIGSIASVPLPPRSDGAPFVAMQDPVQLHLWHEHRIEVPVMPTPSGGRLIRISGQVYNDLSQYRGLADALVTTLSSC